jgi:hypothetical protein
LPRDASAPQDWRRGRADRKIVSAARLIPERRSPQRLPPSSLRGRCSRRRPAISAIRNRAAALRRDRALAIALGEPARVLSFEQLKRSPHVRKLLRVLLHASARALMTYRGHDDRIRTVVEAIGPRSDVLVALINWRESSTAGQVRAFEAAWNGLDETSPLVLWILSAPAPSVGSGFLACSTVGRVAVPAPSRSANAS